MIPPFVHIGTKSEGEKEVFLKLRDDPATEDWVVLHSYDLPQHAGRFMGEIDFLIIIPAQGALCLSVKDCKNVRRDVDGLWHLGALRPSPSGPFKSAREDMFSLKKRMMDTHPGVKGVSFAFAVLFTSTAPRQELRHQPNEWETHEQIFFDEYRRRPLPALLQESLVGSLERLEATTSYRRHGTPTPDQVQELVAYLRPELEFYQPPKVRAQATHDELKRYTEEQFDALDAADFNERVYYDGLAGAGKTLLAIEAAQRETQKPGRRVLFLCFNALLRDWLQEQLTSLREQVDVRTVHSHMRHLANASYVANADAAYYAGVQEKAFERVLEQRDEDIYETLIVDEAQDVFTPEYADVLDGLLKGGIPRGRWLMFGDPGQDIFRDLRRGQTRPDPQASAGREKPFPLAYCEKRGGSAFYIPLRRNCRNTPRIARYAELLGRLQPGYSGYRRPDDLSRPQLRFYESEEDQTAQLIEALSASYREHYEAHEIVVLSARKDGDACAAYVTGSPWKDRLRPLSDKRPGGVRYGTIHRFKGLEAPVVVVTDIHGLGPEDRASLLYVAATRAVNRIVILAHTNVQTEIQQLLLGGSA